MERVAGRKYRPVKFEAMIPRCENEKERKEGKYCYKSFLSKKSRFFEQCCLKTWNGSSSLSLSLSQRREVGESKLLEEGIFRASISRNSSSRKVSHRRRERERERGKNNFEKIIEKLDENILRIGPVDVANFFFSPREREGKSV